MMDIYVNRFGKDNEYKRQIIQAAIDSNMIQGVSSAVIAKGLKAIRLDFIKKSNHGMTKI